MNASTISSGDKGAHGCPVASSTGGSTSGLQSHPTVNRRGFTLYAGVEPVEGEPAEDRVAPAPRVARPVFATKAMSGNRDLDVARARPPARRRRANAGSSAHAMTARYRTVHDDAVGHLTAISVMR